MLYITEESTLLTTLYSSSKSRCAPSCFHPYKATCDTFATCITHDSGKIKMKCNGICNVLYITLLNFIESMNQ